MERKFCEYCHGMTEDDRRGGCTSCGAPRNKEADVLRAAGGFVSVEFMREIMGVKPGEAVYIFPSRLDPTSSGECYV